MKRHHGLVSILCAAAISGCLLAGCQPDVFAPPVSVQSSFPSSNTASSSGGSSSPSDVTSGTTSGLEANPSTGGSSADSSAVTSSSNTWIDAPTTSSGSSHTTATQSQKPATTTSKPTVPPPDEAPITVKTPVASGTLVYTGSGGTIDASNKSEGYILVKYTGSASKMLVQVIAPDRTYNYNIAVNSGYETLPLQGGNGSYQIRFMQNISDSRYRQIYTVTISVSLADGFSPFLYPSQYVSFTADSKAIAKSFELCRGMRTDLQKIDAVYTYIIDTITYDKSSAATVQSGYLPNIDNILSKEKGICFDYAALLAAMLRAQNIPAKLAIGLSPGGNDHAWNLVYTKEKGWVAVALYFEGGAWKLMDATYGASMGEKVENYIGNGSGYTLLRIY